MLKTALVLASVLALSACGEAPIRKTNCWSMSFLPSEECLSVH